MTPCFIDYHDTAKIDEMEFDVRVIAGIESCFVSLPLTLINTLASSGNLPPILALQLRSPHKNNLWHVAWSGSASSPPSISSIQIAQQYAECIGLSDGTVVQVRVVSNFPKASMVTIEPDTEDDWEVLELNSELAEQAILKQLGIVYEGMRFPLWLHGQSVIKFHVSSTSPKTLVVQLVPGSEVAIAPKRRKRNLSSEEESSITSDEISITKALLRVQDPAEQCIHKYEGCSDEMEVTLTSAILIHPETANLYSFQSLEMVVIMARSLSKESKKSNETNKEKTSAKPKEVNGGVHSYNQDNNQVVVRLLFSKSVAKGHVMLPLPLRLYLRASLHSWVFVKRSSVNIEKEIPFVSISPCQFKMIEDDGLSGNNEAEVLVKKNHKVRTNTDTNMGVIDWSVHEKIAMSFSYESPSTKNKETKYNNMKGIANVLCAWFLAQINATTSLAGVGVNSLILGNKTLLHLKVPGNRLINHGKVQTQNSVPLGSKDGIGEQSVDVFYVLSIFDESPSVEKTAAYQLVFDEGNDISSTMRHMEVLLGKLRLSDGFSVETVSESLSAKDPNMTISSLNWMGTAASDVITRLTVLLSPTSGMMFSIYDLPLPGHILIHGPPGCGKTLLATVAAKVLEENEDILAHIVSVPCSKLALEKPSSLRQALLRYISDAMEHAPSIIIFDDLDSIIASSSESDGSQSSSSSAALVQFFADIMDEYEEKQAITCGIGPVAFVASVQSLTSIPQTLSSSGRFDFHIKLPAPAAAEREALLRHEINKRSLQCSDDVLVDVACKCDGYDAYDLEILVDRSIHAAVSRILSSSSSLSNKERPTLIKDDFTDAMHEFLPVAMRDITKPSLDGGRTGWDDVGGLNDICNAIKEMIELPSKFPNIFSQAPLRMRSNVLLYGPPGCGKTHIVGAAAAACSLRFISVKGPELLNKYIGASEQAVRDIFSKAASAAPCLLFFDEFDSIAPKRGHDNTGVTDRVVNQFLTELDGVEVLTGVFVFAATSRPDLLDAALLRPGRLDRLLFCDFPSPRERLDILRVLSRKLQVASDVDLEAIAHMTEGLSGADLQALLSDAQLEAVHEHLNGEQSESGKMPVITDTLLEHIASKAKPSVSENEKQRLYDIYSQFLDSKRSVASQSRDAKGKGKRATLA